MYKGIGSVMVGSAPGGSAFVQTCQVSQLFSLLTAAAFFATYELSKKNLPLSENLAPVKHMVSACLGEFVWKILLAYIYSRYNSK